MSCFANGSATRLFFTELDEGAIPAAAEWTPIRFVSEGLTRETTAIDSNEINPSRQRPVSRQGTYSVTGEVAVEASYGSFDRLIEAALQSEFDTRASLTAITFSAAASDDSFNDSGSGFAALGLVPGDRIVVSGFSTGANNGTFTVVTAVAGKIVVTGDLTDEAVGESVTIATAAESIKVGDDRIEFAVLERHTDRELDYVYMGVEVSQINVSLALNSTVNLTFNLIGRQADAYTIPVAHTFGAQTASQVMVTTAGLFNEGGTPVGYATELTLSIDNGMEANFALFQREAYCVSNGVLVCTGTISAYLVDGTLFNKYLDETLTNIAFDIQDAVTGGNRYRFSLPSVRLVQGTKQVTGPLAIIPQYTYSAGYDGTADTTVEIIRAAA